jgi:hypothetical protein
LEVAETGPRPVGPFDPGQSGLPESIAVEAACGGRVRSGLETLTERYFDVAVEWERFTIYHEGVTADGVTADEYQGAVDRGRLLRNKLGEYQEAAANVRYYGTRVKAEKAKECDKTVIVPFETVVQTRQIEIDYVRDKSAELLEGLRVAAGVKEQ